MVKVCCVKNCNNRSTRESDRRYFSIPGASTKSVNDDTGRVNRLTALRRLKWIDAIRGINVDDAWQAVGSNYVCSDHFQSGQPAELKDDNKLDWVPTLRMGHGEVSHEPEEVEDTGNRWRTWETFVRRIMVYIKSGSHEEELTKTEQRAILKAAKTYFLEGGVLYHQRSGKPLRVVMWEVDHKAVIRQFHVSESGIHSGINATMDRITSKFFWRGIKQDVVQYISHCCGTYRPRDSSKSAASKHQDDNCSSASEDEVSKVESISVVPEIMTASNAIQKIADTISRQKSSRSRSHDDSEQQHSTSTESESHTSVVETEKACGADESAKVKIEPERLGVDEVLILDENEGTFIKVNRKLVESDTISQVPLIDLASGDDAQTKEVAPTQTVVTKDQNLRPDFPDKSISDGLSASATILKLVSNATKEKAANRSLKGRGLNTWSKQKLTQRPELQTKSPISAVTSRPDILTKSPISTVAQRPEIQAKSSIATVAQRPEILAKSTISTVAQRPEIHAKSPISAAAASTKSPAKSEPDSKAPAPKIYRTAAWSLYNIGLKMVRQQVYKELVEIQELKDEQKRLDEGEQRQLEKLKGYYMDLRQKNRYLLTPGKRCRCGYRVTSRQELELHLEYGHGWDSGRYDCCLCKFTSKAFALFSTHMIREHGRKARFQQPLAAFVCPFCTFEHRHNTKKKLLRHIANCERNFQLDHNLAVRAIDSDIPILAPPKPVVSAPASESTSSTPPTTNSKPQPSKNQRSILKTPSTVEASGQTVSGNSGGSLPSKAPQSMPAKSVAYEICEICGGFTKDRASLISHLCAAHNVDIYPVFAKLSDLPIACKSCPERFWTPTGLDRHTSLLHSVATPYPTNPVISVCPLCKRTRLTDVMLHLAQQHRVTLLDMFSVRYCALCLVELHSEKAFENHMITQHSALYPRRSTLLEAIRALEHSRPTTSRPTSAILLALVSRNKYKYGPSRAQLQMYSCPICRCHYGSLDDLTSHFERIHPLKCCRCEYRCKSAEILWRHFRNEHEVVDVCPICEEEVPAGLGTIEHCEKHHLKRCSVALNAFSDVEELQVKGQYAHYVSRKRHQPSSLSDGSETDTVSGDEAAEPKSPKLDDSDLISIDLDAMENC